MVAYRVSSSKNCFIIILIVQVFSLASYGIYFSDSWKPCSVHAVAMYAALLCARQLSGMPCLVAVEVVFLPSLAFFRFSSFSFLNSSSCQAIQSVQLVQLGHITGNLCSSSARLEKMFGQSNFDT